jgi:hypothetical protein
MRAFCGIYAMHCSIDRLSGRSSLSLYISLYIPRESLVSYLVFTQRVRVASCFVIKCTSNPRTHLDFLIYIVYTYVLYPGILYTNTIYRYATYSYLWISPSDGRGMKKIFMRNLLYVYTIRTYSSTIHNTSRLTACISENGSHSSVTSYFYVNL